VEVAALAAAVDAERNYRLASLDAPRPGSEGVAPVGDLDPRYNEVVDHLSLLPLVAAISSRDRRILTMRFYDHMTQTEIAAEVGLSQMHVSRLLRTILARLRAAMTD
jgi:RNA polymerase sigma-B factor